MKQLPDGQYNFKETEEKILKFWQSKPFFKPEFDSKTGQVQTLEEFKADPREKWTLICPPPNAYDRPHMGNLSGYSYMDAMARYNRLRGKRVIMLPGKDHAGLEGEATFIRDVLEKEGKKKSDFTREEFYRRVWEHQQKFVKSISDDEKIMGLSADFDRDLYTLDDRIVNTVLGTFVDMYQKGLLYKGVRIVNWDVKAQSTIPDNQCIREEREGKLYFIKYPLVSESMSQFDGATMSSRAKRSEVEGSPNHSFQSDSGQANSSLLQESQSEAKDQILRQAQHDNVELEFLMVATTRPETMLGDTALVVHPTDERYAHLIGKKVIVPLANREIPIISNGRIEKEFGTGVLKCTPAHAQEDYEIMLEWNSTLSSRAERSEVEGSPNHSFQSDSGQADSSQLQKIQSETKDQILRQAQDDNNKYKIGYINVIDKNLRMVGPIPEKYKGLKVNAAREAIVADLKEAGLIRKEESLTQNVLVSERTGVIVEPLMTSQWFMDVDGFKQPLRDMVTNGDTKIYPKNLEKRYFSWLDNMRDWAISRNLWWGYRLPVWYAGEIVEKINDEGLVELKLQITNYELQKNPSSNKSTLDSSLRWNDKGGELVDFDPSNPEHMKVQIENPGDGWIQDNDILDTWFSSGQWPYAVLGVADMMDVAYPTDVLVSATDLLVKWDLTMMLFSSYKTGKAPFKNLFLTGLVKGTDGQKMSKSKKNFVSLDETREQYGVDSFRMNCFYQNKAGRSYAITPATLKNFRNFNNKLWNASKFVMMNLEGMQDQAWFAELDKVENAEQMFNFEINGEMLPLEPNDILMLDRIKMTEEDFLANMEKYRFGKVTEDLYSSFWTSYCDFYIEASKSRVWKDKESGEYKSTLESRYAAQATLYYCLKSYLKMLHPFIPFVTEEIWQHLVEDGKYEMAMMFDK
jgi:valyl-tRNA synthetase